MYAPNETDKRSFTEILFENRNKTYGAYLLRMEYYRHVFIGLMFSVGIMLAGLLLPYVIGLLKPGPVLLDNSTLVDLHQLPPPPGPIELEYIKPVVQAPVEEVAPVVIKDTIVEKKRQPKVEKTDKNIDVTDTSGKASADTGGGGEGTGSEDEIFRIVDQLPIPPGGNLSEYISKHLRYPEQEKLMNVQGRVYISVIINKDGTLKDVKVAQGVSPGLNEEALRIIKGMPAWQPAKRQGAPVAMIMKIPINFSLKRQ